MVGFVDREVIDTVRDGLLILQGDLVVAFANRSFYRMFEVTRAETEGVRLYDLGDGQWDIPALRHLLENVIPKQWSVEAYEVEHEFPHLGHRVMLLNARKLVGQDGVDLILLAIDDITERRAAEKEREKLSEILQRASQETAHRIKNSLTILSSFARLQQRSAAGEETKNALEAIGTRIDAVSRLYEGLSHQPVPGAPLSVRPYLDALCDDLRQAVMEGTAITLECSSAELELDANRIVALGLAVNELVTNAAKHGFAGRVKGTIRVSLSAADGNLLLNVNEVPRADSGLGQLFLKSFVEQLQGEMAIDSSSAGTSITITLPIERSPGHDA